MVCPRSTLAIAATTSRTGSEIDTATIAMPRSPTNTEITDSTITAISIDAVFSIIQPLDRMITTTAMPMVGSAQVINHISSSRGSTPGAVSRPGVDPITAAVIGRISLNGGRGSMLGALCGVLLLGIVSNILTLSRIEPFWISAAYGAIILLAVATSSFSKHLRR